MAADGKKKKLIDFLNKKAFDPVLEKEKDDFSSDKKRQKLEDVQRSTKSEKERFKNYKDAQEVRENFLSDLNSEPAKKVHRKLKDLDLPVLPDLKEEFLQLCDDLDVRK